MIHESLRSFNYLKVELKNSLWERQRQDTIETYLAINNDDMMHYFRKLAGSPSDVTGLTGWYGHGPSTFGQKIGAFSKLYLVTGDSRLKEKAMYLLEEWGKCARISHQIIDSNGTYVYDKLIGGFLDAYEYLHYENALEYISELTDSAIRRFPTDIKRDGLQDDELWQKNMIEWYTLPENLYRAYQLTGDVKYKTFAKEWDYDYFWDKLLTHDTKIGPRHAYSHVNSLSSAAKAYEATEEKKYLDVMKLAYEEITSKHMFVTGGYGPAECIFADEEGYLGDSIKDEFDVSRKHLLYSNFSGQMVGRSDTWGSCEISCCAWAVFKFCNYLLRFTGDAHYGDWVERMLYNGTGGQLPITNHGKVMYYANYYLDGAVKTVEDRRLMSDGSSFEWQCCTGTFPQDVAEYSNLLYYHDDVAMYVTQYLPSKIRWRSKDSEIILENYSLYPEEEIAKFKIYMNGSQEFTIKFRVPDWADGKNTISINGELLEIESVPGTWMFFNRLWSNEDTIWIAYEFKLRFSPVDEYNKNIVALRYGPIVLCADSMTYLQGDVSHPEKWIHKIDSDSYIFETEKGHVGGYDFLTRKFQPYYKVPSMEWYFIYHRIKDNN